MVVTVVSKKYIIIEMKMVWSVVTYQLINIVFYNEFSQIFAFPAILIVIIKDFRQK